MASAGPPGSESCRNSPIGKANQWLRNSSSSAGSAMYLIPQPPSASSTGLSSAPASVRWNSVAATGGGASSRRIRPAASSWPMRSASRLVAMPGTHEGAIISNGNLYCPKTPRPLLELGPLARTATKEQAADWEREAAELARHKLGRLTADDADGYHRVQCPAAMGKVRCPLRPASMRLDRDRPEILPPPDHPQACCAQQTITVPPHVLAKTAQKHDYPSPAWRRSYARRTGAERGFATAKDPASNDIRRGWCRLMGLTPLMLF